MNKVIPQLIDAIKRHPEIKFIKVSKVEYRLIQREIMNSTYVRPTPRPTYGPPFGDIDRQLWDESYHIRLNMSDLMIMGRKVEIF